jgi:ATP-binding cassette, subfamily B, bacterial PglK
VPTVNAARYETYHQTFLQAPRYAVDSIAFGALIMVAIYYIMHDKVNLVMPILGLYAFAAYRVMPALMQLFSGITTVKYNSACLINLLNEYDKTSNYTIVSSKSDQRIEFNRDLTLRNLSYKYPFSEKYVFENVSLTIKANTTIGIIGESGSGKTTLVDVIMGLLNKSGGDIFVDGSNLKIEGMPAWRMNIGYVPQHIYLTDDTIKRNIAFGVSDNEIDMSAVERAARVAKIHDFIVKELPEGFNTVAGERGVRLSGGQRQRIGIARALYYDPKILVMDEATSSLDNETEQAVMDAINELARKKTIIIIAHRMSTIDKCDYVYKVSEGRLDKIDKQ